MKSPKHVAIILDGNRRYSKKAKLEWWQGHEIGAKKAEDLLFWCKELGIKEITLYIFSVENFKRSKREVDFLMGLFAKKFNQLRDDKRIHENRMRIRFIGNVGMFPDKVKKAIKEIEEATRDYDSYKVNFAMGYSGRAEIVDAVKKIAMKVKEGKLSIDDINEEVVTKNMCLNSEPDLLIRPGGEMRISNFLVWWSSYTELWFTNKLWPEFTKDDLILAIKDYSSRERRFGA